MKENVSQIVFSESERERERELGGMVVV